MGVERNFEGKVALVTGVGRAGQIGNAVCLALGHRGARIVASDRNAVGVAERVREFQAAGIEARPAAGDLTQPDIAALAVEVALRHFGRLDVVVNAAGGLTTYGPVAKATAADFDREFAINVKTAFLVSQAAAPALAASGGCIVNFASIAVERPDTNMAIYTAAKAAVAGLTRALAMELGPQGIRVNAIAPGMVRTGDNVEAVGEGAAYVEMEDITAGIIDLAAPGQATSSEVRPILPRRR